MRVAERLRDALTSRETPSGTDTSINTSDAHSLLQNERRRQALAYVVGTDGDWVSLSELAEHLADSDDSDSRKREYISLYQTHIPKLSDSGLLRYDTQSKEVQSTRMSRRVWAAHQTFARELR